MQRNEAGGAVLAFANHEQGFLPIHVNDLQMQGLGDPQSGAGQQADQGLPGVGPQPAFHGSGPTQQVLELRGAVEMGAATPVGWTEQVTGRHLGLGLAQEEVPGKSANDLQPSGPVEAVAGLRQTRPANSQLAGQRTAVSELIGVSSKAQEFGSLLSESKTERPPVSKISADLGMHGGFHRGIQAKAERPGGVLPDGRGHNARWCSTTGGPVRRQSA